MSSVGLLLACPWPMEEGSTGGTCHFHSTTSNLTITILFSVIFLLSIIGNFAVIFVLLRQRAMRSITNIYLLNLAVSDLLLSVVCMPVTLLNIVTECWLLGDFLCRLFPYLQPVVVTASAYTLAVIAFERYYAICRPLHSRVWQTRSHAYAMISLVWTIAILANLSLLAMYELRSTTQGHWCAPKHHPIIIFIYQIYMTIVLLVIPQIIMFALYGAIIRSLRRGMRLELMALNCVNTNGVDGMAKNGIETNGTTGRKISLVEQVRRSFCKTMTSDDKSPLRDGDNSNGDGRISCILSTHTEKSLMAKQRVIRMLIVIVIVFFCCWTPLYIWWLMLTASDLASVQVWNSTINTIFLVLCYCASCTNPILYCFLNKKFRLALLASFGGKLHRLKSMRAADTTAATLNTDFECAT